MPSSKTLFTSLCNSALLIVWTCFVLGIASCSGPEAPRPRKTPLAKSKKEEPPAEKKKEAAPSRGEALYARHCAACHGENGNGQGLAAQFLFPRPRDFRAGRFRLVSTANGVPTLEDVEAVVIRGMPGSSMPPWAHLDKADLRLLAEQVMHLRKQGARNVMVAWAKENEEELSKEQLAADVARLTTPGKEVQVGEVAGFTPEAVARGGQVYVKKGCAACHGKTGKGDGQQKMVDAEGLPTRPRDLTRGIFKGSPDPASLYRRIWAGMPGSPMPASKALSPKEVADLIHFVLSLSDQAIRESTVLKRRELTARHVKAIPESPLAEEWADIPPAVLRTTPLWWRDDFEPEIEFQAMHDGKSLVLRLSWLDQQADRHALRSESFPDAVAVELFPTKDEPFLGMGAAGSPVDMWMWKAGGQGPADISDVNPNIVVDVYPLGETQVESATYLRKGTRTDNQPPVTFPARASGNQIMPGAGDPRADLTHRMAAAGPGTITFRPRLNQSVTAQGEWNDGRWSVVMKRALTASGSTGGVPIEPGGRVSIAFAVWDGGQQERDGQKRITIWQDLRIEP